MIYDYGEKNGPHTWAVRFPDAGGTRQSPINLNTETMEYDDSLGTLTLKLNHIEKQLVAVRDHNFLVEVVGNSTISGGPLQSEYHLSQFHFHWGSGNTWGSEHLINGVSCPAEMHCVFVNNKYGDESALTYTDGLAVLAVFLQLGSNSNSSLKRLCTILQSMKKGESRELLPVLDMYSILPSDFSRYYTYSGSLTTPPCKECVTWIIMDEPVIINLSQLETMREMHANCVTCHKTDNFRPICPIGSRSIRSSFQW